ncbi:TolC family protein [candidate division TA06 bacterium]|uniref:TolC family protein n=1 Tax=candidate division TA06 bacterium TaxID=2250710 RepID=A0A523XRC0_UNCT6|nr:MAG: TolC family protein [candidate division TA06 bacterium]
MNQFLLCFTILSLVASLGGSLEAQQPMALTLDRAIDMCLSRNWEVKAGLHKVAEAEGGVISARAGFMPTLNLRGSYTRLSEIPSLDMETPILGMQQVPVFGPMGDTIGYTYTLDFVGMEKLGFDMGEEDNYLASVGVTQPIFTWGRTLNGYWLAKHNLNASREDYRKKKQNAVFNVISSFYSVLVGREFLKLTEESYAQVARHAESAARLYREGKASRLDLMRANVARDNMKPQLLKARNSVELAIDGLKLAIGLGAVEQVEIKGELVYEPAEYNFEENLSAATIYRPDLLAAKERKKMASKAFAIAQAGNKPTIVARANYDYKKPYNFKNDWGTDWSATVALSFPIFSGFSTMGESRRAKAQLEQAEVAEGGLKALVELEVKSAYLALKEAEESIKSQKKNIEEAEEAYRIAEEQFENGLLSNIEYLDTQLALSQAKANYVKALGEFNIARAALDRAVGKDY